jgi:uncharacterized membrane protein
VNTPINFRRRIDGTPIAAIAGWGSNGSSERDGHKPGSPTERGIPSIAACFAVGTFRTIDEDAAFGVRQIVDVALKALSPGVNDTTTAVTCVDWLGAILVRLANRSIETPFRSGDGVVRVISAGPTFESMLALAVDEIRQNAASNVTVLGALYDATAPALSQAQLSAQYGSEFAAAFARGQAMAAVPEPTALSLLGLGGLAMLKRRRRQA